MYKYKIYGIGIHSDFKLYNLAETDVPPDAYIRRISDGFDRSEMMAANINYKLVPGGIWFMNDYGQFYVRDGKYIDILPIKENDDFNLSSFICGWCFAHLFAQRGYSAFHCTALKINNACVLISGESGSGKSTTALELIKRGCKYLADDIAMITPDNDFMVYPAFPMQKMCRDVAEKYSSDEIFYVDTDKDKFAHENLNDFCTEPQPLKYVILLDKQNIPAVKVKQVTGINKFTDLINSLFLLESYDGPGMPAEERFRVLKTAEHVNILSISRPSDTDTLVEICDIIEDFCK